MTGLLHRRIHRVSSYVVGSLRSAAVPGQRSPPTEKRS